MKTIEIIDSGQDKYTLKVDTEILGRRYDNIAEQITIVRPQAEIDSTCILVATYGGNVVDHIIVQGDVVDITSNLSQYESVNIGFSFTRPDGYVKGSEIKRFSFLPAPKPDGFVPVPSQQKATVDYLTQYGFVGATLENNILKFKNYAGDDVVEVQLSGFVQEQADWAENDSTKETYIKNKPTSLPNPNKLTIIQDGEQTEYDGSSPVNLTVEGFNLQDLPQFTNKLEIDLSYAPSLNGLITFPIVSSSNFYVNWGDGTGTYYQEVTTSMSHQYEDTNFAGWISIYGDWQGLNFVNNTTQNTKTLTSIIYDDNITEIPNWGLNGNNNSLSNVTTLKLSDNITSIGSYGIGCTKVNSFVFPSSLTTLGSNVFGYTGLYNIDYIKVPSQVTTLNNTSILLYGTSNKNLTVEFAPGLSTTVVFKGSNSVSSILGNLTVIFNGSSSFFNFTTSTPIDSNVKTILVPFTQLYQFKSTTNLVSYADKIYPIGGNYSETITIPSTAWDSETKTATVQAVGATSETRNVIFPSVQGNNDNNVRCTAQGTMTLTFTCDTIPTEDTVVDVSYILTNKNV